MILSSPLLEKKAFTVEALCLASQKIVIDELRRKLAKSAELITS